MEDYYVRSIPRLTLRPVQLFLRRVVWHGVLAATLFLLTDRHILAAERFHDPSTIVRCKDDYWIFSTGPGVRSWRSKDLIHWEEGPHSLENPPPAWIDDIVPDHKGYFWAPDCIRLGERYLLYYSVSGWGRNASAIGLASNPTLDPDDPAYRWTDEGIVIQSTTRDSFNSIDASLLRDPADGRLWMALGSFWSGLKMVELDPINGKRLHPDAPLVPLAFHKEIEAPCLIAHGGAYYLIYNWGLCCRGAKSTYELRVGRSDRVTGPYLDRAGVDLRVNGGSLFLGTQRSFVKAVTNGSATTSTTRPTAALARWQCVGCNGMRMAGQCRESFCGRNNHNNQLTVDPNHQTYETLRLVALPVATSALDICC